MLKAGGLTIDLESGEVRRQDGSRPTLPPKAIDLLLLLARQNHRQVLREDIVSELWRKRIVEPTALNHLIFQIRNAINDPDRVILETIPKRGFALHADNFPELILRDTRHAADTNLVIKNDNLAHQDSVNIGEFGKLPETKLDHKYSFSTKKPKVLFVTIATVALIALSWQYFWSSSALDPSKLTGPTLWLSAETPPILREILTARAKLTASNVQVQIGSPKQVAPSDWIIFVAPETNVFTLTHQGQRRTYTLSQFLTEVSPLVLGPKHLEAIPGEPIGALRSSRGTYQQVYESQVSNAARAINSTSEWAALRDFLLLSGAQNDASIIENDNAVLNALKNTPVLASLDSHSLQISFEDRHFESKDLWQKLCRDSRIESRSWFNGNCLFQRGVERLKIMDYASAASNFTLAQKVFIEVQDSEKAMICEVLSLALTGSTPQHQDMARLRMLRDPEDLILMLWIFQRQYPDVAFELAMAMYRTSLLKKQAKIQLEIHAVLGRTAMYSTDVQKKRVAIQLLEESKLKAPNDAVRSQLASTLMDVYHSLGQVDEALRAREAISVMESTSYTCVSAFIAVEANSLALAKRDFALCQEMKRNPTFFSLGMFADVGSIAMARIEDLPRKELNQRLEATIAQWRTSAQDKPNWALVTKMLFVQAAALGRIDWLEQEWANLRPAQRAGLASRGYSEEMHFDLIHARSNRALIHGQRDNIANETGGSGLVQAVFLESLRLGHCAGTPSQFEQWISPMQARGNDLAVKELKSVEKRCADKSLFLPGATWPIFI